MSLLKPACTHPAITYPKPFRKSLGLWFDNEGKDYPWRRTRDPYHILVSEMMLQQTRIATVLGKGYYTHFLKTFPDLTTLASASDEALLKAWEGLGYYRRARMLRATAQYLNQHHQGIFPENEGDLQDLPGIGPYTSAALRAFAFDQPSPLLDGNVSRILSRLTDDPAPIDQSATIRKHRELSLFLCDPEKPARHHHAMMELGQTFCKPGTPHCHSCPVAAHCLTRQPELLPTKKARPSVTPITENAIWTKNFDEALLLHKEVGSRRKGMWKLPLRSAEFCKPLEKLLTETYTITRYKVTLNIYLADESSPSENDNWIQIDTLNSKPIAAPFRRAIEKLLVTH